MPPPPMPPPNFTGLTETELRAMEGQERDNVEARIRCLRNIQVLLDAAVMEMQQYSNVVTRLNRAVPASAAAAATEEGPNVPAATSSSTAGTTTANASSSVPSTTPTTSSTAASAATATKETGTKPKTATVSAAAAAAAVSEKESVEGASASKAESDMTKIIEKMDASEDKDKGSSDNEEKDELRRRRLARFEQQAKDQ